VLSRDKDELPEFPFIRIWLCQSRRTALDLRKKSFSRSIRIIVFLLKDPYPETIGKANQQYRNLLGPRLCDRADGKALGAFDKCCQDIDSQVRFEVIAASPTPHHMGLAGGFGGCIGRIFGNHHARAYLRDTRTIVAIACTLAIASIRAGERQGWLSGRSIVATEIPGLRQSRTWLSVVGQGRFLFFLLPLLFYELASLFVLGHVESRIVPYAHACFHLGHDAILFHADIIDIILGHFIDESRAGSKLGPCVRRSK